MSLIALANFAKSSIVPRGPSLWLQNLLTFVPFGDDLLLERRCKDVFVYVKTINRVLKNKWKTTEML